MNQFCIWQGSAERRQTRYAGWENSCSNTSGRARHATCWKHLGKKSILQDSEKMTKTLGWCVDARWVSNDTNCFFRSGRFDCRIHVKSTQIWSANGAQQTKQTRLKDISTAWHSWNFFLTSHRNAFILSWRALALARTRSGESRKSNRPSATAFVPFQCV